MERIGRGYSVHIEPVRDEYTGDISFTVDEFHIEDMASIDDNSQPGDIVIYDWDNEKYRLKLHKLLELSNSPDRLNSTNTEYELYKALNKS